ncbi:hypothetical protein WDZ17_06145 [Pseudokineococcus basanitobsidens]|uniref:ABC-2 type transport system permease protein n=1 Tax=Pseudokineococcus basanitobsidens TaxID=1926649 RepID=A0ABU8RIG6_9ACTN
MVGELVALRLALWRAALRRDTWRVVVLVVGGLYGLGLAAGVLVGLAALPGAPPGVARGVVVVAGAVLVLGWVVVPLVAFGADPSLDPARFATLPVRPRPLATGLLVAALVGVPGALSLLVGAGTALAWAPRQDGVAAVVTGLLAVVGGVVGVLTAVAAGRLATTAAAGLLSGRRAREVSAVVGVLALAMLGPALASGGVAVPALAEPSSAVTTVVDVLAWTPPGLAWAVPADAAAGAWGTAVVRLLLAAAVLVLLVLAWAAVLGRRLTAPRPRPGGRGSGRAAPARPSAGLVARLPEGVRWAVAHRCLTSWRRDPRYVVNAAGSLAVPAVLVASTALGTLPDGVLWALGPLVALVLGTVLHDDVAYDGPAFWTHLAAGVRGVEDRAGRAGALLVLALPLVLLVTVLGVVLATRGAPPGADAAGRLAAVAGVAVALLLAGTAASSVVSAVRPYPVQAAGENPFSQPSGAAVPAFVAQTLCLLATALLALPAVVAGVLAAVLAPALGPLALLAAVVLGALELREGVRRGGALVDRRGPELLAAVRRDS